MTNNVDRHTTDAHDAPTTPEIVPIRTGRLADLADGPRSHELLAKAWLAGYRNKNTRDGYQLSIARWFSFCDQHDIDPRQAIRAHLELWQRSLEQDGLAPRSIAARLNACASFYKYLVEEDVLDRDPMRGVRRPKIERRSPTAWLTRPQMSDLLAGGEALGPHPYALLCLLSLNGLRIAEACSLDVRSLSWDGHYPVVTFIRKGGKEGTAALSRPTEAAVRAAIGSRTEGPLLLTQAGTRMNREAAQRIITQALKSVRGDHGKITPHALRHSWATACLDAHVPSDQVQHDGGWSDMRMVTYYSHGQSKAARAATHAVSAYVYGAA